MKQPHGSIQRSGDSEARPEQGERQLGPDRSASNARQRIRAASQQEPSRNSQSGPSLQTSVRSTHSSTMAPSPSGWHSGLPRSAEPLRQHSKPAGW